MSLLLKSPVQLHFINTPKGTYSNTQFFSGYNMCTKFDYFCCSKIMLNFLFLSQKYSCPCPYSPLYYRSWKSENYIRWFVSSMLTWLRDVALKGQQKNYPLCITSRLHCYFRKQDFFLYQTSLDAVYVWKMSKENSEAESLKNERKYFVVVVVVFTEF